MHFHDYQKEALKTAKRFHNPQVTMLYFSGALCGEAGEAFEIIKKHVRDGAPIDRLDLMKELGDVLWYLAMVCETHGIELDSVAWLNLHKLKARFPTGKYRTEDLKPERKAVMDALMGLPEDDLNRRLDETKRRINNAYGKRGQKGGE